MNSFKPLNLLNNREFWPEKAAIVDAIKEVLTLGKCRRPLPISDFGRYRGIEWRNSQNELIPFQSVDWYVSNAMDEARLQVDVGRMLESFAREPWRRHDALGDHYDLFVMDEDMFDPREGEGSYVVGRSHRMKVAVVSTYRIEHIWGMPYSYLKTEVMRQLCFMFGVPDPHRPGLRVIGERYYCDNVCILRPAQSAPGDWEKLTEDRLMFGALCERCVDELRLFFREVERDAN